MTWTKAKVLRQIKSLKGQISTLTRRANEVCSWEKGKEPEFKFSEVLAEKQRLSAELVHLKSALAESNAVGKIVFEDKEISVQEAIDFLAELKGEISFWESLSVKNETETEYKRVLGREGIENVEVARVFISAITEVEKAQSMARLREKVESLNDVLEAHNHLSEISF